MSESSTVRQDEQVSINTGFTDRGYEPPSSGGLCTGETVIA